MLITRSAALSVKLPVLAKTPVNCAGTRRETLVTAGARVNYRGWNHLVRLASARHPAWYTLDLSITSAGLSSRPRRPRSGHLIGRAGFRRDLCSLFALRIDCSPGGEGAGGGRCLDTSARGRVQRSRTLLYRRQTGVTHQWVWDGAV